MWWGIELFDLSPGALFMCGVVLVFSSWAPNRIRGVSLVFGGLGHILRWLGKNAFAHCGYGIVDMFPWDFWGQSPLIKQMHQCYGEYHSTGKWNLAAL